MGLKSLHCRHQLDGVTVAFIHKEILGKWLAWLLIVGHAGAALYHHYVKKDHTLRKMTKF